MSQRGGKSRQLRIIGGELRHRQLVFPAVEGLRPTADRIRETLFNWLQQDIVGARCLDLFAGSGALGIEALSRGAAAVDLVEINAAAVAMLRRNLSRFDLPAARVYQADVRSWLAARAGGEPEYQLVFIDPPYADGQLPAVCEGLQEAKVLARAAKIYLEHDSPVDRSALPAAWSQLKEKKAGQVYYYLFQFGAGD